MKTQEFGIIPKGVRVEDRFTGEQGVNLGYLKDGLQEVQLDDGSIVKIKRVNLIEVEE